MRFFLCSESMPSLRICILALFFYLFLSFLGFFLSPPGQWAGQNNAYCGEKYWGRGGSCMRTNCAERAAAEEKAKEEELMHKNWGRRWI